MEKENDANDPTLKRLKAMPDDKIEFSNSLIEGIKLHYDSFKHLTTLSTSSILILSAFINDTFDNPKAKVLIPFIFFCFFVSTLGSVIIMIGYGALLKKIYTKDIRKNKNIYLVSGIIGGLGMFIMGLLFLVVFTVLNSI